MIKSVARHYNSLRKIIFITFLLSISFLHITGSYADTIRVIREDGYHSVSSLHTIDTGSIRYVSVQQLADVLQARTYYSNKAKKVIVYLGRQEVKLTAFNSFVVIGSSIRQLPAEVLYYHGDIIVPLRFFIDLLGEFYLGEIVFNSDEETLRIVPDMENIIGVSVEEKSNGTLLRISTTKVFDESDVYTSASSNWLYIDVYGGKVDTLKQYYARASGPVREVKPVQLSEEAARLSFKFKSKIGKRQVNVRENPSEILISLRTQEKISNDILTNLRNEREKWHIDTIIIDPGHGGKDPGAIGPTGLYEKDVTLAIAKELHKLLEKEFDVNVYMTRETDKFVPLKERTSFANRHQGKLFISIHVNSNKSRRVYGYTTYFLGVAKTEEALEVARRENSVIKEYESSANDYADLSNENFILASMAQNAFNKESEDFAGFIQLSMHDQLRGKNRGVEQAGYHVLIGASMPNILIETGFISNRSEEKKLRENSYRKKIARAIFEGIKKFKERYESLI